MYQRLRIAEYLYLSDCDSIEGRPILGQPVRFVGKGKIIFHGSVHLGIGPGPDWIGGYGYIEARWPDSVIEIGDGAYINNSCTFVSEGPGISIGKRAMIGWKCEIIDSDFHDIHPQRRETGTPRRAKVVIGDNVLVGANVKIFRGVTIGENTVIANSTVVTRSVPANVLVYGNPERGGRLIDLKRKKNFDSNG